MTKTEKPTNTARKALEHAYLLYEAVGNAQPRMLIVFPRVNDRFPSHKCMKLAAEDAERVGRQVNNWFGSNILLSNDVAKETFCIDVPGTTHQVLGCMIEVPREAQDLFKAKQARYDLIAEERVLFSEGNIESLLCLRDHVNDANMQHCR